MPRGSLVPTTVNFLDCVMWFVFWVYVLCVLFMQVATKQTPLGDNKVHLDLDKLGR